MQRITIRNRPKQSVKIRSHLIAPTDDVIIVAKTITENGFYNAKDENAKAYNPVRVEVPTFEEENAELTVENSQLKADIIVKNQQIAELEQDVEEAFENGKQAEYDIFWDAYQNNGYPMDYSYSFACPSWTDKSFKPKYDINATVFSTAFKNATITNLTKIMQERNVIFITSECKIFLQAFQSANITHIPEIDVSNATNLNYTFANGNLVRIENIKVSAQTPFSNTFNNTSKLEYVAFDGEIGQNGLNFKDSKKLSKESITSIINALSSTTSGLSITFSKVAVQNAFGISDITDESTWTEEFRTLRNSKLNWTFNYS